MLRTHNNIVVGMQNQTVEVNYPIIFFNDEQRISINKLLDLLINASPLRLMLFAKQMEVVLRKDLGIDIFRYILAESNPHNLFWFADFAKIDLNKLLNKCDSTVCSNTPIEESFFITLMENTCASSDLSAVLSNLNKLGFNLNQQYMGGFTLLHFIANSRNYESTNQQRTLRALLDNGADLNIENATGETVLKYCKNMEMANYLIQQPECIIDYKNTNHSVAIKKSTFKSPRIYNYCFEHGGIQVAISNIERKLLASVTSSGLTSKSIKPASFRI